MADPVYATATQGFFRVEIPDRFEIVLRDLGFVNSDDKNARLGVKWFDREDDSFEIYGYEDFSVMWDHDDQSGVEKEVCIEDLIQGFILPGECAMIIGVSNEKLRSIYGWAMAVTKDHVYRTSLSRFIELFEQLPSEPGEERFWVDDSLHLAEGGDPFDSGGFGIVDEEYGGIVAYTNSPERARAILRALTELACESP